MIFIIIFLYFCLAVFGLTVIAAAWQHFKGEADRLKNGANAHDRLGDSPEISPSGALLEHTAPKVMAPPSPLNDPQIRVLGASRKVRTSVGETPFGLRDKLMARILEARLDE